MVARGHARKPQRDQQRGQQIYRGEIADADWDWKPGTIRHGDDQRVHREFFPAQEREQDERAANYGKRACHWHGNQCARDDDQRERKPKPG